MNSSADYPLGYTDAEHERLISQAARMAPITERLFREAGIGLRQRVLDIGSGVGDVALLAAKLVGSAGEVVGVERDAKSIARARVRAAEVGARNISFIHAEVSDVPAGDPFDAVVGRFILMFLPDPAAVLRSLSRLVRPGGILVFQEPSWVPVLALLKPLPVWSAVASLIHETFLCAGANPELGVQLYTVFENAGLPGPSMYAEMVMGKDQSIAEWYYDLLRTLLPQMQQLNLPVETVGNLDTLLRRLQDAAVASNTVVSSPAFVGAWSRID